MKRLIFLRHAKSSWDSDSVNDHSRPLNERGRSEAPLLGPRLTDRGCRPDLVLCSDAARARQTWELAASTMDPKPTTELDRRLYLAGPHQIREILAGRDDADVETLLLVGHNPGWEHCVAWFTGEEITLKTATAAVLKAKHDGPWSEQLARAESFTLEDVFRAVDS